MEVLRDHLREHDSGAAQPTVVDQSGDEEAAPRSGAAQSSTTDSLPCHSSGATQPTATDSRPYPTVPLSSLSGHIRQYSICYLCALGNEIQKPAQCSSCGSKRVTVLMVASPETWPAVRFATSCYRCKRQVNANAIGCYTVTRSALHYGNSPICFRCYGVDV